MASVDTSSFLKIFTIRWPCFVGTPRSPFLISVNECMHNISITNGRICHSTTFLTSTFCSSTFPPVVVREMPSEAAAGNIRAEITT